MSTRRQPTRTDSSIVEHQLQELIVAGANPAPTPVLSPLGRAPFFSPSRHLARNPAMTTALQTSLPESQHGPAERLLDLILGSSAHLWHNRPGVDVAGTWRPAKGARAGGGAVAPGLFVPS